jgi:acyl carrier protein
MNETQIYADLGKIFSDVLKKPGLQLTAESTASDVEGWTSLTHMILIDTIEGHYKIKFKLNEIVKFRNVGEMVASIMKKLNK